MLAGKKAQWVYLWLVFFFFLVLSLLPKEICVYVTKLLVYLWSFFILERQLESASGKLWYLRAMQKSTLKLRKTADGGKLRESIRLGTRSLVMWDENYRIACSGNPRD